MLSSLWPAHIVKYVPTWFPGAGFKRKAYEWRKLSQAMLERPFDMVKERVVRAIDFSQRE